jgi:hypothetical protein
VDVTLSNDNALVKLNLAARTNQLTSAGTGNLTGLTNRSLDTDRTSIGSGQLDLSLLTEGTEDGYTSQLLLRANYGYSLSTSVLTGLGKIFLRGKLSACAEQNLKMLFGYMQMTCGSLN